MAHSHAQEHQAIRVSRRVGRWLIIALVACGVGALVGLALWWPTGSRPQTSTTTNGVPFVHGTVVSVIGEPCAGSLDPTQIGCHRVIVRITSGPTKGQKGEIEQTLTDTSKPRLHDGDKIVLAYTASAPTFARYAYADFQRGTPMLLLGLCFVGAVLLVGRRYGLQAIAGLGASFVVLTVFLLPALERGSSPLGVALVSTTLVAYLALYLAHGISMRTSVALLGTLGALLLTVGLAVVFVHAARLTGLTDENVLYLQLGSSNVDASGLLLAGMVVGTLGVLTDVTVTQVAAVAELASLDSTRTARQLYHSGLRIGRDHISATVNTLVLAYAGVALPLLLLFSEGGRPIGQVLTSEVVAVEVIRTLIGGIGLVAAVPITTILAAIVLAGSGRAPIPAEPT